MKCKLYNLLGLDKSLADPLVSAPIASCHQVSDATRFEECFDLGVRIEVLYEAHDFHESQSDDGSLFPMGLAPSIVPQPLCCLHSLVHPRSRLHKRQHSERVFLQKIVN